MSQRIKSTKAKRSRGFTYLWIAGLAFVIFFLLWKEQTSVLYVLATLGVTVLLVIVALADLGQSELSAEPNTQMPTAPISRPKTGR
jgi:hypothetical protein